MAAKEKPDTIFIAYDLVMTPKLQIQLINNTLISWATEKRHEFLSHSNLLLRKKK